MPLYRLNSHIFFFAHIPKTGGSTVEDVLTALGCKESLNYYRRLGYCRCTPQHMHEALYKNFVPASFYDFSFTVVRHPFARLVSEYKWQHRPKWNRTHIPFDDWIKATLLTYQRNNFVYDNHIRPQVEYLTEGMKVFRLEDELDGLFAEILPKIGLDSAEIPRKWQKKSQFQELTITESTFTQVQEFYKGDYARFGYDPALIPAGVSMDAGTEPQQASWLLRTFARRREP